MDITRDIKRRKDERIAETESGSSTTKAHSLRSGNDDGELDMGNPQEKRALKRVRTLLGEATKIQPCPGCKHDMQIFCAFLDEKTRAVDSGAERVSREERKKLYDIDFINEVTNIGIFMTKASRPFLPLLSLVPPEVYTKTLNNDMPANREVRKLLAEARGELSVLAKCDIEYKRALDLVDSFIKAVDFKLGIDPVQFYVFDKLVRFGYKTHMLGLVGRGITSAKRALNPGMYE